MPKQELQGDTTFGIERVAAMYYLYILKSLNSGKYYIGETNSIERRCQQHIEGKSSFGKRNANLIIAYKKKFNNRSEAKKFENFLKRQKSHQFIDKLISGNIHIPP